MSARYQCLACLGSYSDTQRDGTLYYHACAPIAGPLARLPPDDPRRDPTDSAELPNARDENVAPLVGAGPGGLRVPPPRGMRRAGAGRRRLA